LNGKKEKREKDTQNIVINVHRKDNHCTTPTQHTKETPKNEGRQISEKKTPPPPPQQQQQQQLIVKRMSE
jgi:hypothetical protein